MMTMIRGYLRDLGAGCRILASRAFWREFRAYWSAAAVAARMDAWTERLKASAADPAATAPGPTEQAEAQQ
jgi:hypothetical protein